MVGVIFPIDFIFLLFFVCWLVDFCLFKEVLSNQEPISSLYTFFLMLLDFIIIIRALINYIKLIITL